MKYSVEITNAARRAIDAEFRYIAIERQSPLNASNWLEEIFDTIEGLELMPQRFGLAQESAFKPYEVRRAIAGNFLILFRIDESLSKLYVIGFRHGSRMPHPSGLE